MITRIVLLFSGMVFLTACSTASSLLSFDDGEEAMPVAVEAPAVAAPALAANLDEWCQRVAASDRARAQEAGYDAATLDRMTLASFQQCRTLSAQ